MWCVVSAANSRKLCHAHSALGGKETWGASLGLSLPLISFSLLSFPWLLVLFRMYCITIFYLFYWEVSVAIAEKWELTLKALFFFFLLGCCQEEHVHLFRHSGWRWRQISIETTSPRKIVMYRTYIEHNPLYFLCVHFFPFIIFPLLSSDFKIRA